jgi:hypothetical protein
LQGDGVAEDFELVDQAADLAVGMDAADVEVRAEVVEADGGIGQWVPDDDQDGSGDRDQCFEFAAAFDQAPVPLTEEGVGFGGRGGGFAEDAFEVGVALAGLAAALFGPGLDVRVGR